MMMLTRQTRLQKVISTILLQSMRELPKLTGALTKVLIKSMHLKTSPQQVNHCIENMPNNIVVIILVYVDDLQITSNNTKSILQFIKELGNNYDIGSHNELHYYSGLEFTRNQRQTTGCIHQSKYIKDIYSRISTWTKQKE